MQGPGFLAYHSVQMVAGYCNVYVYVYEYVYGDGLKVLECNCANLCPHSHIHLFSPIICSSEVKPIRLRSSVH